tara:strand:- start:3329 stop:6094 length:2766 start_codon:yes stop_codon:yes gene_type:complete
MMNRGVLSRQMFAKGGAAFPDLNKDGEITQADILMGRGVEFKQEGGIAGMMPPPAAEQLDPQVVDQMLATASQTTGDLEGAQDYEQMMNMVRGDDATMGERREELAGVVGPEDAMQTPESVLALVQPVMQIAAVDQGIGELAQQEMQQPMEGPMAQGIMENVAPPEPMGGPPPVNFKDGGLVRRGDNQPVKMMQLGGDPFASTPGRLGELARERYAARENLLGDPEGRLREQKELTQAQMLFDLANTGLAFAAPMQGERAGLSPAERLAMAAQQTKLFPTIGARAQQQFEAKKAIDKERQGLQLAALGSAETALAAEQKAAAELAQEEARQAGAIAQIELKDKLGLKTQTALSNLGLANKLKLAEVGQGYAIDLENLRNTNQITRDEYNATKKEELLLVQQEGQRALAVLQGQIDFKSRTDLQAQAAAISKELETVKSELRIQEKGVDLENQLELAGVQQAYQIERMGIGQEQNIALADHNAALSATAQERTQAFTAAQAALDRAQRENLQLSDQTFRQLMQEEMQKFTSDQSDIDRAIAQSQRDIENALAERGMDIKLEQLNLGLAAQALDEQYKLGMLAVAEAAENATKLGSKAKTAQLTYLTDKERLEAYASGTLGDDTALFEQTLIEYAKPSYTWTGSSYVKNPTPQLAPAIQEALKTRKAGGFVTPTIPGVSMPKPKDDTATGDGPVDVNSTEFKQSLFTPEGELDLSSSSWEKIPNTVIDPSIEYQRATGLGELTQRISNYFTETFRETGLAGPMSEEGKELTRADRDIMSLREELLRAINNMSDDRVLKNDQDAMRELTAGFAPGLFKTDETALSTLRGMRALLQRAFTSYASTDPEYFPESRGMYDDDIVTKDRRTALRLRSLLKDVITLEQNYNTYLGGGSKASRRDGRKTDRSTTNETRSIINELAEGKDK